MLCKAIAPKSYKYFVQCTGDTNTNTKIQCTNICKYRQKLTVWPGNSIFQKNRKISKIMDNLSANVENTPVFFGRCCPFSVKTFYILANEDNRGQKTLRGICCEVATSFFCPVFLFLYFCVFLTYRDWANVEISRVCRAHLCWWRAHKEKKATGTWTITHIFIIVIIVYLFSFIELSLTSSSLS